MASGNSYWSLYETVETTPGEFSETIVASNRDNVSIFRTPIARGESQSYSLSFADTALQTLPQGSTVSVNTDVGELVGQTSFTVGNTNGTPNPISQTDLNTNITISSAKTKNVFGGDTIGFTLKNTLAEGDDATTANLTIEITSSGGVVTSQFITVDLQ